MADQPTHEEHASAAGHGHNPLAGEHLIGHVKDADYFEVPRILGGKLYLPQPLLRSEPVVELKTGFPPIDERIEPFDLKLTKFMVLEVIAAVILIVLCTRAAARIKGQHAPRGKLVNAIEAVIVYIRDEIARPAIGHHDADHFMPYLLTIFFFVVSCNLLGMVPWAGSATGALGTTGMLALVTDRKSTRLNSSHIQKSRMPSSA